MIDIPKKLIKLIEEQKTCSEICQELEISNEDLYDKLLQLKNRGMFLKRRYYSNGDIRYSKIIAPSAISDQYGSTSSTIITPHSENNLRCLVISDLHFGNELERLDLIDEAFNYCKKNNIHTIICCGDLIDGTYTKGSQALPGIGDQLDHFIYNYPSDNGILTFCVAGDHDFSILRDQGIDFIEAVRNYRHDIIVGGYNSSELFIKNDKLQLFHRPSKSARQTDAPIVLCGHSHMYVTEVVGNSLRVKVPSLSGLCNVPTALEMTLTFKNGYFETSVIKQLVFANEFVPISENIYDALKYRQVPTTEIRNEEDFSESKKMEIVEEPKKDEESESATASEPVSGDKPKVYAKSYSHLNQVEKFNLRYGITDTN